LEVTSKPSEMMPKGFGNCWSPSVHEGKERFFIE